MVLTSSLHAATFYVSPGCADANPGTEGQPFASLKQAQIAERKLAGKEAVTVLLKAGTHFLPNPLVFTSVDSGTKTAPVVYQAVPSKKPVVSGGVNLDLDKPGIVLITIKLTQKPDEAVMNLRSTMLKPSNA